MTPQDFNKAIHNLTELMISNMPHINERVALNASALVKNRVVNTGQGPDGALLGMYEDGPYKKYREANGRQTSFVDFKFSGDTMRDIGIRKTISNGLVITTSVGARNTKNRKGGSQTSDIVDGLGDRYGNFLLPDEEEKKLLGQQITNEVNNLIKQAFSI